MCHGLGATAWPLGSMAGSLIVGWPVQVVNPDSLSAAQLRPTPQHWSGPPGEQCYVDKLMLTQNDEMEEIYKVGVRWSTQPLFGSRGGCAGVCWLNKSFVSIGAGVACSEVGVSLLGCPHVGPADAD